MNTRLKQLSPLQSPDPRPASACPSTVKVKWIERSAESKLDVNTICATMQNYVTKDIGSLRKSMVLPIPIPALLTKMVSFFNHYRYAGICSIVILFPKRITTANSTHLLSQSPLGATGWSSVSEGEATAQHTMVTYAPWPILLAYPKETGDGDRQVRHCDGTVNSVG